MTVALSNEMMLVLIFTPLTVVVLVIILVWGAVQVYRLASNSGPVEGEEDRRLPKLIGDSRRNSSYLASEFVDPSKTTSSVRTILLSDENSIVGDAAFAGTLDPMVCGSGGPNVTCFASQPQGGEEESNTVFAVRFFNQTQNHFNEPAETSRVSINDRPVSEVFKQACCFGCCLWQRRAEQLGDSNEPRLMNFDNVEPKAFVDHTLPKQFLRDRQSITLSDLLRVQRANYREFMESTLKRHPTGMRDSIRGNNFAPTAEDVPDGTQQMVNHHGVPQSSADASKVVDFSNIRDTVINIPDDNNKSNVNSELDINDHTNKNHFNKCELSVLHEATCPINSGYQYSIVIHDQRPLDSTGIAPSSDYVDVVVNKLYDSSNSESIDESLNNVLLQRSLDSSSSGVSVDTSDIVFSSQESIMNSYTGDSTDPANQLPISVQKCKSHPWQLKSALRTTSIVSMRPTDLDKAGETFANKNEQFHPPLSNPEVNVPQVVLTNGLPGSVQQQQLPDHLPRLARVERGEESEDSQSDKENRTAVDHVFEPDYTDEEYTQSLNQPVDPSFHHVTIHGKKFDRYWV